MIWRVRVEAEDPDLELHEDYNACYNVIDLKSWKWWSSGRGLPVVDLHFVWKLVESVIIQNGVKLEVVEGLPGVEEVTSEEEREEV